MTGWNSMKCGRLSWKRWINVGCGLPYVVGHARLWHLWSETVAKRLASSCGRVFLKNTNHVVRSATFGVLTKRCFPKRPIAVSARRAVKPIMWNAGTIPAANRTRATFVKPYRFQSPISTTNWLLDYLSSVTISLNHHFQLNHYRKK